MIPTYIDLYCERIEAGFWNEPLNAVTNIVFVLAAFLAWHTIANRSYSDIWEKCVVALVALIGVGSFLFHTFATTWAAQADIFPIWAFVICYIVLATHRLCQHNTSKTIVVVTTSVGLIGFCKLIAFELGGINTTDNLLGTFGGNATAFIHAQESLLNGSEQYFPALIAMLVFTAFCLFFRHPARIYFACASALFCGALFFRTIDIAACNATHGIGTHFLWHCLNGLVVGLLLQALVKTMPPKRASSGT